MKNFTLDLLASVSSPTIHPGGERAVVSVTRPDLSADAYVGQLWSVPLAGESGAPRRITRGFRDTQPKFSPGGDLIAFVRSAPKQPGQVYVVDADGGEPVQVTDQKLGVSEFQWAPDGGRIAFTARVPEHGRYGTVPDLGPDAEAPRRFTELKYRFNGVGYTTDRRIQLFLVDVPDVAAEPAVAPLATADGKDYETPATVPAATQLSEGPWDTTDPAFSPDGSRIAVLSSRHEHRDNDLVSDIFEYTLGDGAEPTRVQLDGGKYKVVQVAYAPAGGFLLLAQDIGESGLDFVAKYTALYALDAGTSAPRRLTDAETVDVQHADGGLTVTADGAAIVMNATRGTAQLLKVTPAGDVEELTSGNVVVTGVDAVGDTVVAAYHDDKSTGEVALIGSGGLKQITEFSAGLRGAGILDIEEQTVAARDGYPVHGWVVKPEGEGPFPVLLTIHGGPFAQYTGSYFDEAQVYAQAGYAVVMCNPRGSSGYGQKHGRAIRQAFGTVDYTDIMDFFDGVLAGDATLDAARVGVQGGSYGGYMTAWIIAHEQRFAGAVVERGFLDPVSFAGASDIGDYFGQEYTGTDPELVASQSPQAHVGQVKTPTLVLHSTDDLRCPVEQGERYFAALKRNGVETEMVIFPGENHELSRNGRPRHRVQRFDAILDWWSRYLPV